MEKIRVNTTFTQPYLDFIDKFVREGAYFNRGQVIMAGLRLLSREEGVPIFPEVNIDE